MVKELVHDPMFLAQKSEPVTEADAQVITDLLVLATVMIVFAFFAFANAFTCNKKFNRL